MCSERPCVSAVIYGGFLIELNMFSLYEKLLSTITSRSCCVASLCVQHHCVLSVFISGRWIQTDESSLLVQVILRLHLKMNMI